VVNVSGHADILSRAAEFLKHGGKVAVCTVVERKGSGPSEVGSKMLVVEGGEVIGTIGGGECFERVLISESLQAIRDGRSKNLKFSFYGGAKEGELDTGLWCGGEMTIFADVMEPNPKLVLVGSGHIALPTYKIADLLGFETIVVDDNKDTLTRKRFPNAKLIYHRNFGAALKKVKGDKSTYVAIMHGEPKHDLISLRRFIKEETAYLGILGSRNKVAKLKNILRKDGVGEKKIERVRTPIGLEINARTPEEIAVSIAAELVKERRSSRG